MFFDRDQNLRKRKQIAYRDQLKQEINLKNSKIISRPERSSNNQQQSFSLLKNIEIEQQNRRNKQSNYYAELRNQIQKEKQQKKRKKQQEARKQREQQQKIRRDNQILKQRAQIQKMQEGRKKGYQQNSNATTNDRPINRIKIEPSQTVQNNKKNQQQNYQSQNQLSQNYLSRPKTTQDQRDQGLLPIEGYLSKQQMSSKEGPYSMSQLPTYMNKIENEPFNFLPKRRYMDSYFHQLLGEKKKFQQEAHQISQLNRIFYQQRARPQKVESRGLNQLKKLQALLDQKGAQYMASYSNVKNYDHYDQFDSLKKLTIPSFENSTINQSRWRKLD